MTPCWLLVLLCSPLWHSEGVEGWGGLSTVPSESECRPYIEKALKELTPEDPLEAVDATGSENETPPSQSADQEGSIEETEEATTKESIETFGEGQLKSEEESSETGETTDTESTEENPNKEAKPDEEVTQADEPSEGLESTETQESTLQEIENETNDEESTGTDEEKVNVTADKPSSEDGSESTETEDKAEATSTEGTDDASAIERSDETPDDATTEEKSNEDNTLSGEENVLETTESTEQEAEDVIQPEESEEKGDTAEQSSSEEKPEEAKEATSEESTERVDKSEETTERVDKSEEAQSTEEVGDRSAEVQGGEETDSAETNESLETKSLESTEPQESIETKSDEEPKDIKEDTTEAETSTEDSAQITKESEEEAAEGKSESASEESSSETTATSTTEEMLESSTEAIPEPTEEPSATPKDDVVPDTIQATPTIEKDKENEAEVVEPTEQEPATEEEPVKEAEPTTTAEDQLTLMFEVPKVRRPRDHIAEILNLTPESAETELLLAKTIDSTLRDLKKLYDSAIQPLEILYKYRDLSNRHFGDPEIFSKPLILFMGPWSGGKSTILNYLMDNEFKSSSLRTGAEPSPAYFNILMWGEREEVLDGTQLAADWTFSGLQKFGQGLLDRLRGLRLKSPLLEKVNIVEIPGILEIRKQVERLFPFNDACQWFIDRADIIFLVYDPSKLDVGPETEAILDQLKGREYQTRIILNKADQVKPEELMRVQGTLIWNISPLMSSQEPPVMYSTSLWSIPYEQGAPSRLLHAQERAFLRDLRTAIDKRVENKIASARRFAVRVRNHAKMVDCYLTTYYNHKTFFGNRKKVADDIIETPQKYHIYEGLSTLTNISRYDLPDPEVYRDFFQLNPVYDFQRLSDTCTYFRGCPINRLDVAIAYDLPELVGKYKKQAERVLEAAEKQAAKS